MENENIEIPINLTKREWQALSELVAIGIHEIVRPEQEPLWIAAKKLEGQVEKKSPELWTGYLYAPGGDDLI